MNARAVVWKSDRSSNGRKKVVSKLVSLMQCAAVRTSVRDTAAPLHPPPTKPTPLNGLSLALERIASAGDCVTSMVTAEAAEAAQSATAQRKYLNMNDPQENGPTLHPLAHPASTA